MKISARPMKKGEGEAIVKIHRRAVHEIACVDYPSEVLNGWAETLSDETLKAKASKFDDKLGKGVFTIVAEVDGALAGFGEVIPKINVLGAIYINPDFKRIGVGTAILSELENIARAHGATDLHMDSSLTAEQFYLMNGYEVIERGIHTLNSGVKMPCVKMKKKIG